MGQVHCGIYETNLFITSQDSLSHGCQVTLGRSKQNIEDGVGGRVHLEPSLERVDLESLLTLACKVIIVVEVEDLHQFLWKARVEAGDDCNTVSRICYFVYLMRPCHGDAIKWKHVPHYWPYVWGIHRSQVNSPQKGTVTRSFDVFFDLRLE